MATKTFALLGVALVACSQAPETGPTTTARTAPAITKTDRPSVTFAHSGRGTAIVPGQLIVKYESDGPHRLTQCAERWLREKQSFRLATADASDSLDRLNADAGVYRARALSPGRAGLSTEAAKRQAQARFATAAARVKARAGRLAALPAAPAADLTNLYLLDVPANTDVEALARRFEQDPHVAYAQPNYRLKTVLVPNDPFYASAGSWGQPFDDLWGLKKMGLATAWDQALGTGVVVAVVDSGADLTHPDLQANLWVNSDEIAGNGLDDDGNGFADDRNGWDFFNGDANPSDDNGHGTHVAGTIAAVGNNGVGISGVAPGAQIMPIKGFDSTGNGNSAGLAAAIVYAANNGADVINNSWSCTSACPSNPAVEDAVLHAKSLGAVSVFAAGNDAGADVVQLSPQNRPEVIVVSASDPNDQLASFSNTGFIDVAAPGGGPSAGPPAFEPFRSILSLKSSVCDASLCQPGLLVGTNYVRQAGTSMAAPHVSGLAALILQQHPTYTPEQVRQVLRRSSLDLGPTGVDSSFGYGRVRADQALLEPVPLQALITSPVNPTFTAVTSAPILGTASGTGFANYRVEVGAGLTPASFTTITTSTTQVTNGQLAAWNPSTLPEGNHTLRVVATTTDGRTYEDRQRVLVDNIVITEPAATVLSHPASLAFRSGTQPITIRGTVAPASFTRYTLAVRRGDGSLVSNPNITLTNGGLQRVVNGDLAVWNPSGLPADNYTLELTVTPSSGSPILQTAGVVVDPSLHPGWPKSLGFIGSIGEFLIVATAISDHLIAADVDGNGSAELIGGYGSSVRVIDHTGADLPGWPRTVDPTSVGTIAFKSPAVGDVTGDASPEIVGTNDRGDVFVWSANGDLLSGWPRNYGPRASAPAIADIDGNGTNEIVLTGWADGWVRVVNSAGTSLPGWPVQLSPTSAGLSPPAVGDVDGNGTREILVADALPPTNLYLLSSTGQVLSGWPKPINPGVQPFALTTYPMLGDLDGDGDLEELMGAQDGRVVAFHHTGAAVSGFPLQGRTSVVNSPVLGDIDGTNGPELIAGYVTNSNFNEAFAWPSTGGAPLPGWPVTRDTEQGSFGFTAPAIADVDADGKADVVVSGDMSADPVKTLHAFRFDGSAVTGFPKLTAWYAPWPSNSPAVADMDGDGQLEVAWVDLLGNLYMWDVASPATGPQPWPMFGQNPRLTAQAPVSASTPTCTTSAQCDDGDFCNGQETCNAGTCTPGTPWGSACSSATTLARYANSGNIGTAERWFVVTDPNPINGWQVSNLSSRIVRVNGVQRTPGQMPMPARYNGKYYFQFTAGTPAWTSWSFW